MTSHTSTKTHFGMDERGLGGTHMIQQQFLTMHRKIREAQKQVDNNPPTASMFRRPYFSQFSCEYWERIKPPTLQCRARVDSSPPESYKLISGLYINKRKSNSTSRSPAAKKREAAASLLPQMRSSDPRSRALDVPRCNTLDEYAAFCEERRKVIASQMRALQDKRQRRGRDLTGGENTSESNVDSIATAAMAALASIADAAATEKQPQPRASVYLRHPADNDVLDLDPIAPLAAAPLVPTPPPRDRPRVGGEHVVATPQRALATATLTPRKMLPAVADAASDAHQATRMGVLFATPKTSGIVAGGEQRPVALIQHFVDDEDRFDEHD